MTATRSDGRLLAGAVAAAVATFLLFRLLVGGDLPGLLGLELPRAAEEAVVAAAARDRPAVRDARPATPAPVVVEPRRTPTGPPRRIVSRPFLPPALPVAAPAPRQGMEFPSPPSPPPLPAPRPLPALPAPQPVTLEPVTVEPPPPSPLPEVELEPLPSFELPPLPPAPQLLDEPPLPLP